MAHDKAWLEAGRRQIRRLSTFSIGMLLSVLGSYGFGRVVGMGMWRWRLHHDQAGLDSALLRLHACWIVFVLSVIGLLVSTYKRQKLVREYNRVVLEDDPMLLGNHIPIVK